MTTSSSTDAGGETPTLRAALLAYGNARARSVGAARRTLDIGEGDARAMLHIADHPGIRPSQLREFLDITAAGVTAIRTGRSCGSAGTCSSTSSS